MIILMIYLKHLLDLYIIKEMNIIPLLFPDSQLLNLNPFILHKNNLLSNPNSQEELFPLIELENNTL